jgi:predicted O-methyltransferase YrrM
MKPAEVRKVIGDVPYMTLDQGETLTEFIHQNAIKDVLELGFCHGVSTCYMAAALAEKGAGSITSIDLEGARTEKPNVEELLLRIDQRDRVKLYYEHTSYTWRLMRFLEEDPTPRFDFCFLDGAHNWFVDGFAFLLADRLLRPNGWFIFDDLHWIDGGSTDAGKAMSDEERNCAQVQKIYEVLVKPHPCYGDFRTEDRWAYAHKKSDSVLKPVAVKSEHVVKMVPVPWARLTSKIRKVMGTPQSH